MVLVNSWTLLIIFAKSSILYISEYVTANYNKITVNYYHKAALWLSSSF